MMRLFAITGLALAATITFACRNAEPAPLADQTQAQLPIPTNTDDASRRKAILTAARDYRDFDLANDVANWAPFFCRAPMPTGPIFSDSDDSPTHGRKLYYLYARDAQRYLNPDEQNNAQPEGQTLVKESWHPVEVDTDASAGDSTINNYVEVPPGGRTRHGVARPPAMRDGKLYQPGEKGPLFIMHYLGKDAPQTDDGWIYATLTPDGGEITAMGLIESCMKCHQDAPHGRLFGLRRQNPVVQPSNGAAADAHPG